MKKYIAHVLSIGTLNPYTGKHKYSKNNGWNIYDEKENGETWATGMTAILVGYNKRKPAFIVFHAQNNIKAGDEILLKNNDTGRKVNSSFYTVVDTVSAEKESLNKMLLEYGFDYRPTKAFRKKQFNNKLATCFVTKGVELVKQTKILSIKKHALSVFFCNLNTMNEHILSLIETGDRNNIYIALQLAKQTKPKTNILKYFLQLFNFANIHTHNITDEQLVNKLVNLFNIKLLKFGNFNDVPKNIAALKHLKQIHIQYGSGEMPKHIFNTNISTIKIYNSNDVYVPSEINNAKKLTGFSIKTLKGFEIPANIFCSSVKALGINAEYIKFPENIKCSSKIKSLSLNTKLKIYNVPESFFKLKLNRLILPNANEELVIKIVENISTLKMLALSKQTSYNYLFEEKLKKINSELFITIV